MTFEELQKNIIEWQHHNFPNAQPYEPLLGAVEEIGELSHAHLKSVQKIRGTQHEFAIAKKDAVGDTIVYLIHYARLHGFTLTEALEEAWNTIKHRDWIKFPTDGLTH